VNKTRAKVYKSQYILHPCDSVIKQYNLVLGKGWWCSAAGKVNAGLAESNGSLQLGEW